MSYYTYLNIISKKEGEINDDIENRDFEGNEGLSFDQDDYEKIDGEEPIAFFEESTLKFLNHGFKNFREILNFQGYFIQDYDEINEKLNGNLLEKEGLSLNSLFDLDDEDTLYALSNLVPWVINNEKFINNVYERGDEFILTDELADGEGYIGGENLKKIFYLFLKEKDNL